MKHWFTSLLAALGLLTSTTVFAQKVGIGTTTPTEQLDVNGNLRVRGLTGIESRLVQVQPDGTLGVGSELPPVTVLNAPPNLGSVSVQAPRGVAVAGDFLYVTQYIGNNNCVLQVFDISNPTLPVAVGTPVSGGNRLDLLTVNGSYIYVCDLNANRIRIYTTTGAGTPTSPSLVSTIQGSLNGPNGIAVVGSKMFVSNYNNSTISRFSITNPAAPVFEANVPAGTNVAGLTGLNGYLYAANYGADQLQTYAVNATTGALTSQGVVNVGDQPNAVATANNLLYLTNSGAAALQVFNINAPAQPVALNSATTGVHPYGFAVKGNYAYLANTFSNTIEVRQLTISNALGFDNNGVLTSLPSTAFGDGLGTHLATRNLNLNGNQLVGGTLTSPGTSGVFVSPGGVVGIGNQTPLGKLDIQGGANSTGANNAGGVAFSYNNGTNTGFRHFLRTRHNPSVNGAGNAMDFYLNNSNNFNGSSAAGTGNVQVLTLESNNGAPRAGVGTTTPAATLDVNGTVKLGASGTAINSLIRHTTANINLDAIAAGTDFNMDVTVPYTLLASATVTVSPGNDLPPGVIIGYARVLTPGAPNTATVRVRVSNTSGAVQNPGNMPYYFTITQ